MIEVVIILITMLLVMGLVVGYILWEMKTFNKRVVQKKVVSGNKTIMYDKGRLIKDRQGNTWWKLKKVKTAFGKRIPVPPREVIELDQKGRECIIYYADTNGEIQWSQDNTKNLSEITTQPVTTQQRALLVNEIEKSQLRKKTGLKDVLAQIAIPFMFVIVIAILVFGYADFNKAKIDRVQAEKDRDQVYLDILEVQNGIKDDLDFIKGEDETKARDIPT